MSGFYPFSVSQALTGYVRRYSGMHNERIEAAFLTTQIQRRPAEVVYKKYVNVVGVNQSSR